MRRFFLLAGGLLLSLALIACGGGGDDDAGVCERCTGNADTCMVVCEGVECDFCNECGDGLTCELFIGGTTGDRCAVDSFEEDTCCIDDRRVDCDTGEPI